MEPTTTTPTPTNEVLLLTRNLTKHQAAVVILAIMNDTVFSDADVTLIARLYVENLTIRSEDFS